MTHETLGQSDKTILRGQTVKLDSPLSDLIKRCESLCSAKCCGLDAYDFSPLHMASFLIMYNGDIEQSEIRLLTDQIDRLSENYGKSGAICQGVAIEGVDRTFSAEDIDSMVNELKSNLKLALQYVRDSETRRYKNRDPL